MKLSRSFHFDGYAWVRSCEVLSNNTLQRPQTALVDIACPWAVDCRWKHCWRGDAHFGCLFPAYVQIFPLQTCLGIFMTKTQHCFSVWKGNPVFFYFFFFSKPLAKDTIPSGESYVYLTTSTVLYQEKGPLLLFSYLTLFSSPRLCYGGEITRLSRTSKGRVYKFKGSL